MHARTYTWARRLAAIAIASSLSLGRGEAQTAPEAQMTPLLVTLLATPRAVPQSDDRWQVPYELEITNATNEPISITAVEVRDARWVDTAISRLGKADVEKALHLPGGKTTATLGPAQSGVLLINLSFANRESIAAEIEHVISATAPPGGKVPPRLSQKVARVAVDSSAPLVLGPPLRGDRWVAEASCCNSYHRKAVLPINGRRYLAQRFAIDWVQIDAKNRLAKGDPKRVASYPQYGSDVIAVANGTVVHVTDGLPEQTPGALPANVTLQTADGNSIVVDLGNGRFALYAHLQPGSIKVRDGERLTRGQVIAKLGNSGNTSAPHLHFHVMDAASPLAANGLPYVIDAFEQSGVAESKDDLDSELRTATRPIRVRAQAGQHANQLPANLSVVNFAD